MKLVVVDKPRTAQENLALNQACLEEVSSGRYEQIVRIYSFSRPGVILAYNEDIWDVREEAHDQIDLVRRPTGGSVVYVDEKTLGYSVFIPSGSKINITRIYQEFTDKVLDAFRSCGLKDVSIGNWYARLNGGIIAGHAQQNKASASEFQGLLRLEPWDMDALEKTLRLRSLAEYNGERYLIIDNAVFDLKGKITDIPVQDVKVLRDEYDELNRTPSLASYGVQTPDLMERLATSLSGTNDRHALPDSIMNSAESFLTKFTERSYVFKSGKRGLGHCFVDFVESE